jgi:hypothetical protein
MKQVSRPRAQQWKHIRVGSAVRIPENVVSNLARFHARCDINGHCVSSSDARNIRREYSIAISDFGPTVVPKPAFWATDPPFVELFTEVLGAPLGESAYTLPGGRGIQGGAGGDLDDTAPRSS